MDSELAKMMTLVDHGDDSGTVERWFAVLEESFKGPDGKPDDWATFAARLRDSAGQFDSSTVSLFLDQATVRLSDPLRSVERFTTEVGASKAFDAYRQARSELGTDGDAATGGSSATSASKPDWARFVTFLDRNDHGWQQTWPESRKWLVYTARHVEGFGPEIDSFESYADRGYPLAQILETHGATAGGDTATPGGEPDWARFVTFLNRNDHGWQQTWPESRKWLVYTARHVEGFGPEIDSFESYADQGYPLAQILEVHGAPAP